MFRSPCADAILSRVVVAYVPRARTGTAIEKIEFKIAKADVQHLERFLKVLNAQCTLDLTKWNIRVKNVKDEIIPKEYWPTYCLGRKNLAVKVGPRPLHTV